MKAFTKTLAIISALMLLANAVPMDNIVVQATSELTYAAEAAQSDTPEESPDAMDKTLFKRAITDTKAAIVRFVTEKPAADTVIPLNEAETVQAAFDAESATLYVYAENGGKVIAPADCSQLYYMRTYLTEIDCSALDTSNVTNMNEMFYNCWNLTKLNVSGFDTSNVTYMDRMFYGCKTVTKLNVSGFDTSKVKDLSYMFRC